MSDQYHDRHVVSRGLAVLVVIAVIYFGVVVYGEQSRKGNTDEEGGIVPFVSNGNTGQSNQNGGTVVFEGEDFYQNGFYSADGGYLSPGGLEKIGVMVTLQEDVVTDVQVIEKGTTPTSKKFQADFAAHYKPFVVGKPIDEVALDKVSGSSLTPKGFNDAIAKIRADARS